MRDHDTSHDELLKELASLRAQLAAQQAAMSGTVNGHGATVSAAGEALQGELAAARGILSSLAECLCVLDREGRIVSTNPAAEALLGWSEDELRGRPLHEVAHRHAPPQHDGADCPLLGVPLTRQATRGDDIFMHKDGGHV